MKRVMSKQIRAILSSFIIISIILTNAMSTTVFASSEIQQTKELSKSNKSIKQSQKYNITFDYQQKGYPLKLLRQQLSLLKKTDMQLQRLWKEFRVKQLLNTF